MRPLTILACAVVLAIVYRPAAANNDGAMPADGAWFLCEFAHSRIPPPDDCRIMDDDGFLIARGFIHRIKVTNSRHEGCRHARLGQCFSRHRAEVTVESWPIGPIRPAPGGFSVGFLGCTQSYRIVAHGSGEDGFSEVAPTGEPCFWTRDKHYFVAPFTGRLRITEK